MLLCRVCRSGVRPGEGVERHFRTHKLKGPELADIVRYYSDMELDNPMTGRLPDDGLAPVEELPIVRGYSCRACRFHTISPKVAEQHWRTAGHASQGGRTPQASKYVAAQLQTWLGGKYARYWAVRTSDADHGERPVVDSVLESMITECEAEQKVEDDSRRRKGDAKEGLDRDDAWVSYMGWVRHFGSRDKLAIFDAAEWVRARAVKKQAVQGPEQEREEAALVRLGQSFDREIERYCARLDCVPVETLQRLASVSPTMLQGKPFGRKGREDSMVKYRSVGHRYLGFCYRAYKLGREEALEQLGISFTAEQWGLFGDIMHELGEGGSDDTQDSGFFSGSSARSNSDSDSDDADDDDDANDDEEAEAADGNGSGTRFASADEALDGAVYRFLISSIRQNIGGKVYANPLLCFCAALGIWKAPLGFVQPQLYTGLLAGIMWWARLVFLESTFEHQLRDLDEVSVDAVLAFQEEHAKWMCINTHTVVSTIVNWMAYGKGHRQRTGGQPSTRWTEDGSALFHSGDRVGVEDFKKTMRDLVGEAEGFMDEMMNHSWAKVSDRLDMNRISDCTVRLGAGQSFATDPKNEWLEPGPGKVTRLAGPTLWNAAHNRWKLPRVKKWLRLLRQFREAAMVLVHVWGGQPGRGPEVTTLRHCDSWQLMRNMFVLDGQVMLITDRDKVKAMRDNGRKVARFLPPRIGKMMVAYVAWLLPFERMLRRRCTLPEPPDDMLEFMWRDGCSARLWETERLSSALARIMQAGTGVRITVARYRPIAIEMGRRIRGLVLAQLEARAEDGDDDDDVDVDPMTGEPIDCGGSWHIVWDLQATHGTKVAMQHYAVHVNYPGQLQPQMIATFREISRLWHQFLEHDAAPATGARKRKNKEVTGHEAAKRFRLATTTVEAQPERDPEQERMAGLRKLLGPNASWRSPKQEQSMKTNMELLHGQSAINVLPTGAGKSILFMLPAVLADGGTSIVVVPFVSLVDDLLTRARAMGVDCIQFKTSLSCGREGLPRAARLVIVSADIVSNAEMIAYADGLFAAGLLRRIFIDECHTAITDAGYRRKLSELKGLHRYGCPVIMLTATMPVVLEDWFRRAMLAEAAAMVRDRTTKLNCRYRVEKIKPGRDVVALHVAGLVQQYTECMARNEKGVVYCRSKAQCESLAERIGCTFHHSGMPDERRRDVREAWTAGSGHRWITATSGLGTGIDIAGIIAVIHAEQPYGLVEFVQQTGRGARRADEVVESIIVHDGRPPREDEHQDWVGMCNEAEMKAFMSTPGCRRAVLGAFMDGVGGEVCGHIRGAIPCDRCSAAWKVAEREQPAADRGGAVWQAFNRDEGRRRRTLTRWLEEVADECAICHVQRHYDARLLASVPDEPRHASGDEICSGIGQYRYRYLRKKVTFGSHSCCFMCKLPLDWCEPTRQDGQCEYMDKVLPVALMALQSQEVRTLARERFDVDAEDHEAFFRWLGRDRLFHGTKGTNALALWEAVVWEAYKEGRYWFRYDDCIDIDHENRATAQGPPDNRDVARGKVTDGDEFGDATDGEEFGDATDCDELGAESGDRCAAASPQQQPQEEEQERQDGLVNRSGEHVQDESTQQGELHKWLEGIQAIGCSVCHVRWQLRGAPEDERAEVEHERADCKLIKQTDFNRWQAQLAIRDSDCCWECGLPHDWCDREKAAGQCRFRNKVLPVVMLAQRGRGGTSSVRTLVSEALGVEMEGGEAYREWVVRPRQMYGKTMSNGLAVWDAVVQHCARRLAGEATRTSR